MSVIALRADESISPLFDHNPSLSGALLNEMLHKEGTISVDPDGRYSITPFASTVAVNEQLDIDNPQWKDAVDQMQLTYYRELLGRIDPEEKPTPDQSPLAIHAHRRLDIHQRSWLQRHPQD